MNIKKILKYIFTLVLSLVIVVLIYVGYVYFSYSRISDNQVLENNNNNLQQLEIDKNYSATTFNIGYGSYPPDYTFFMDGGKSSKAKSKESVIEMIDGVISDLKKINSDFILLQEVDENSTRSHHVNEFDLIKSQFSSYSNTSAINYDSAFLMYPVFDPIGKSKSGLLTMTNSKINESIRYSLPIETNFNKFFDLDRAFTVSKIPVNNGKYLMLYNVHLSAYIKDEKIQEEQINKLFTQMKNDYLMGNYVVCGGDFNHDLLESSSEFFNNQDKNDYTWLQPFPLNDLPKQLSLVKFTSKDEIAPSTRNLDKPYVENESFVALIDGFIVSENVKIINKKVNDLDFIHSDHNPVTIKFKLEK